MYLFFDVETDGLPKSYKAPVTDVNNWPRMVQLAWLAYDFAGNKVASRNAIIKPEGFTIPEHVSKIHGITTERALAEGENVQDVLRTFYQQIERCEYLVGHNVSFDVNVTGSEFVRLGLPPIVTSRPKICTMMASTKFCNLPGRCGPKWPKLQELHRKLFSEDFDSAHNAAADIDATARCFFELKRLEVIKIYE